MPQALKAKDVPKTLQKTKAKNQSCQMSSAAKTKMSQPARAKDESKTLLVSKVKEAPKFQKAKGKQNIKFKPPAKAPGEFQQ